MLFKDLEKVTDGCEKPKTGMVGGEQGRPTFSSGRRKDVLFSTNLDK